MSDSTGGGPDNGPDRRQFLAGGAIATGAMAGGLIAGYGMFAKCAGEYLYPSDEGTAWMFVTDAASLAPGQAISFTSPTGVPVVITRKSGEQGAGGKEQGATSAEFLALSSVCPHLGCRVHWEPQNDRFFCPCHLGAFDAEGRPTAGPPLAANQSLPEYPLRVEKGLLYINMPMKPLDQSTYRVAETARSKEQGARSETLQSDSMLRAPSSPLPAPFSKLPPGGLA